MDTFNSKRKYSPSEDAALIEQLAAYDQLPNTTQNVLQLADRFCHNNNSQQQVQVCGLTLLRMLQKVSYEFMTHLLLDQLETLQRTILIRFGDCQLSKSTRRICGDIIRRLLSLTMHCHSHAEVNHDEHSLPWPQLFDQLLQVADDESQETNLRCMSLVVFAENMDEFYRFFSDIKFAERHGRFVEIVKRWLNGSNFEFVIAAAECTCKSFRWQQQERHRFSAPHTRIINASFEEMVLSFLRAYRNVCDVDEYDAEKQTEFGKRIESFFDSGNSHELFQQPNQFHHVCDVFMPICRKNVGKNREIVDVLCSIMLLSTKPKTAIHEFIASTPGEITKLFNFFLDLMCRWLEVEYDAEEWPHSFRPLSEDMCDLEEFFGFDRAFHYILTVSVNFDGKEISSGIEQMLQQLLDRNNNNDNNSNNDASSPASQKIPFNSAASTFQQNSFVLNNKYPQWMISASVLWCFGRADQVLLNRLVKNLYSLLNNFVLPAAVNHDHPLVRYSAVESVWRFYWRKFLPLDDSEKARSTRKRFLEILASKLHAAQDCFRVQEIAGNAIREVFMERVDLNSTDDTAENISDAKESSLPNLFVQSLFDSLSNHESKPNFVISSHLRALADVCDMTSSEHPLNFNHQLLPLLQHLVQKYHSILLQEIETSSNNNNNDDDEEESEFSRTARLNPSFNFDLPCFTNSIRAATRVFKFIPPSEENQTVAKELTSFVVEMLETLHLRAKDQILLDMLYALEFLCTRLGKNNFPNDCGGADLVDRMMPPLIHYAMLDHTIRKKIRIAGEEVSDQIVQVKKAAADIMCQLCMGRGELIKLKWTSSIGDIIIHLMEIQGESQTTMHKIGYDLFIAVGNAIGHPTNMDEEYVLEELARKKFVCSNTNDNNSNDESQPTIEETPKPDPEEWKFLTKVANRIALRFLGLTKVLDFENNFPPEPGIANMEEWISDPDPSVPKRTPIIIACLLPHISPSIWQQFAEVILCQLVAMIRRRDPLCLGIFELERAKPTDEFDKEHSALMEKATTLQARRQQQEQQRQQELLLQARPTKPSLESGNRRQRQGDSDDDAEIREQETLRENQLDEDVLVRQLERAKQKYFNEGDDASLDECFRALRKCLKIALAGIPASTVTYLWGESKLKEQLEHAIGRNLGRDLLGLPLHDWTSHFDRYYQFAERFLAEDAERGRMKNNNNDSNNSSLPVSLPLKTRLELVMPMEPSLDLSLALSRMTHVPRMMKSVLGSDFFNTLVELSGDAKTDTVGVNPFILSCVDSSFAKIVALIRKFKLIPLPEHSGEHAVDFVFERNKELVWELERLLGAADNFLDFFCWNLSSLSTAKGSVLRVAKEMSKRNGDNEFGAILEALAAEKPNLFIQMYMALQCEAILGVVDGLFEIFPTEVTERKTAISNDTFEFADNFLSFTISTVIFDILQSLRIYIAEQRENENEEVNEEKRNMPLKFMDATATKLLEKLTKYEVLFKQHQKQQIEGNVETHEIENNQEEGENNTSNNEQDAAAKSENNEPPKLWITYVIEGIEKMMCDDNEEQTTTEN